MKTSPLQIIKEACIKANPHKDWNISDRTDGMWEEKITLADVLYAIPLKMDLELEHKETTLEIGFDDHADEDSYIKWCSWNLLKPLEEQDEKTLKFIASLINP